MFIFSTSQTEATVFLCVFCHSRKIICPFDGVCGTKCGEPPIFLYLHSQYIINLKMCSLYLHLVWLSCMSNAIWGAIYIIKQSKCNWWEIIVEPYRLLDCQNNEPLVYFCDSDKNVLPSCKLQFKIHHGQTKYHVSWATNSICEELSVQHPPPQTRKLRLNEFWCLTSNFNY